MPISFANPVLLFGTLAAALPILIHLLSRRRVRKQEFSDLRFLEDVRSRQNRSLGLRRWLLLLLRVLTLLLIALAAAQPRWGGLAAAGRGSRSVLFVVDASASMKTQTEAGTRFAAAVDAVREMIRSLPDETSVQVIAAGAETVPLFGDWLPAGTVADRGLLEFVCSDGAFDLAAALRRAAEQIDRAPGLPVEMILVGDLQDTGPPADLAEAAARLQRTGETVLLVRRVGTAAPGGGVLDVILPARAVLLGENLTLRAVVQPEYEDQVFWLDLDGRPVAEAVAEGPPDGVRELGFPLSLPRAGLFRGVVRKESDVFSQDDSRPFLLEVPESLDVLLVHGRDRTVDGAAGRGGWRYLAAALGPGSGPSLFRVRAMTDAETTTGDLFASAVVVFVDPDPLGRRILAGLQDFLTGGGSVLFLTGEPAHAEYLETTLLPLLGLPEKAQWRGVAETGAQRLSIVDRSHPVFSGLGDEAVATLEEVRLLQWIGVDEGENRVMLELAGGAPVLVEGALGSGRFALAPFDLRPAASNLAASPMALPLLQRVTAWLAAGSGSVRAVNVLVGETAEVAAVAGRSDAGDDRVAVVTVSGPDNRTPRTARRTWRGERAFLTTGLIREAGFYTFGGGADTVGQAAAAVPLAESRLELHTVQEWTNMLAGHGLEVALDLSDSRPEDLVTVLAGRDLAPWLLLTAILLLLAEVALGRGTGAGSDPPTTG